MDDKMTVFGDWALSNPSPRTLLSSFLNEGFESKSFSDIFAENGSNGSLPKFKNPEMPVNPKEEAVGDEFDFSNDISLEPKLFDFRKSSSSGCLAQRIARTGFNAPTINTARIKLGNTPFSQSEIRSPYLTIPPGLSPTVLLDSPVFLSNSMAQPSPTTGKISFKINETNSFSISASDSAVPDESKDDHLEDNAPAGFSFESPLNMSLLASSSSSSSFPCQEDRGPSAIDRPHSLQDMEASFQKDFDFPASFSEPSDRKDGAVDSTICRRPTDSFISNENSTPLDDLPNKEGTQGELSSITVATPAEDGYSWRKSGQKQVNASEYPRSYYKCTHPNCQAKKMIERSHDGHITETIHKGAHNHTKPLPHRRPGMPFSHPFNDARVEGLEHNGSHVNFDATVTSFGDPFAAIQTEDLSLFASPEAIDVSSSVSNDGEEEDRAAHGSISLGGEGEGEGEESESKRRKLDACAVEMSSVSRPLREPRVVIQTISEVDILDDGYRWRKYGQKVVKGNPNPRSYYKCTYLGCTVRKHVERTSHDLESVITTYEGKHNHEVPAARNSSHSNPAPSVTPPTDQHMTLNKRPYPTQATLMPGTLGLPGREQQLGFRPGFSFGTGQQGLANVGIGTGLGPSFLR